MIRHQVLVVRRRDKEFNIFALVECVGLITHSHFTTLLQQTPLWCLL